MEYLTINGIQVPAPNRGHNFEIATTVNGGKNAVGTFVGQKVGRDQYKIDNLTWSRLSAEEWSRILTLFESFVVTVKMPDMVHNKWITLKMYPGNRTAVPAEWGADGLPTVYKDCKVNIIDCGVIE